MKNAYPFILIIIFLLISLQNTQAQNKNLTISSKEEFNSAILDSIPFNNSHHSKSDIIVEIIKISNKLTHRGFFNNTYNLTNKDSIFHCIFSLNKKIDSIRINYTSPQINNTLLKKISNRFTSEYFEISTNEIESSLTKIITYFENNGYSFTTCLLNNITLNKSKLNASLNLNISKKRKINNIVIKGYDQFPKKFIKHHLNLETNKPFNLNLIEVISSRLKSIPFITQIKEPEILFTKDSTTLYLYIKRQNKSNFDGIIGFSNKKESNKIQLNGNLNLNLNNALNKGESFSFHWRNDGKNSQRLDLNFSSPFLFNTPITSSSNFSIQKQDTTYNTTNLKLSLNYKIIGNNFLGASFETENSNTNQIAPTINQIESYDKYFYGLHYNHNSLTLNNSLLSSKFQFNFGFEFGNRKSNHISTSQQQFLLSTHYYLSILPRSSIFIKNSTKLLISNNTLINELYRIGGSSTIRGFDEQSIFTSKYLIINLEYQHKTNPTSYLYTITDFAFLLDNSTNSINHKIGFGIGYHQISKNNTIDLSYAIGKNQNEQIKTNNSKIHVRIIHFLN